MHRIRKHIARLWLKYQISLMVVSLFVTGVAFAGESSPESSASAASSSSTGTSSMSTQETTTTRDVSSKELLSKELLSKEAITIYSLYLGAEGTSVSDINNKTTVRTQLMLYNQIYRWENCCGLDFFGDVILTSVTSSSTTTASTATVSQAIGGDINLYLKFPIRREATHPENWISTLGLIYSFETLKPTNANEATRSSYFGVRLQYNTESFADLLYGRTEGIGGSRGELRVQAPIKQLNLLGNSPTIVGLIANLGIRDRPQNNVDSIKMYVMWRVSIENIFKGGSP